MKTSLITRFLTASNLLPILVPIGVATVVTCYLWDLVDLKSAQNVVSLLTLVASIMYLISVV